MKGVASFWKHKTVATCCNNSKSSSRALTRDKEYSAWMKRGLSKKMYIRNWENRPSANYKF